MKLECFSLNSLCYVFPLLRRITDKVLNNDSSNKETFGCPPAVSEFSDIKNELTLMVNNIEFRNINNDFQKKLKNTSMRLKRVIKYLPL